MTQPVTPELRKWIVEQASAGQSPDAVLKSMLASGWREEVAVAVHVMGDADHGRLAFLGAPARVAGHALVDLEI